MVVAGPYSNFVVGAYGVEYIIGSLVLVERLPPVYAGDDGGVWKVGVIKALVGRAKRRPAPYLQEPVVLARRGNHFRVCREVSKLDGACQLLCPYLLCCAVGVE